MSRFEELAALVTEVQKTEHRYMLHGPRHDPVVTPWMPYRPADFVSIIWECLPELITGCCFLDVGCGPGTKMQIARDLFGLSVSGLEIDAEMAKLAAGIGHVACIDASEFKAYQFYDLIWLYRPFRDARLEYELEKRITGQMKPGAILAGSSWETDPGALGWQPVVDDCLLSPDGRNSIIQGAWQKLK